MGLICYIWKVKCSRRDDHSGSIYGEQMGRGVSVFVFVLFEDFYTAWISWWHFHTKHQYWYVFFSSLHEPILLRQANLRTLSFYCQLEHIQRHDYWEPVFQACQMHRAASPTSFGSLSPRCAFPVYSAASLHQNQVFTAPST